MPQKSQKQVRAFIGLVNYYMGMWAKRSHLLHPFTSLTSNKVKFEWTDVEQKSFDEIKHVVACDNLLFYPYFNKHFDIHTDASDLQMGALISQYQKPIAFYSRKLRVQQTKYTVMEKRIT